MVVETKESHCQPKKQVYQFLRRKEVSQSRLPRIIRTTDSGQMEDNLGVTWKPVFCGGGRREKVIRMKDVADIH